MRSTPVTKASFSRSVWGRAAFRVLGWGQRPVQVGAGLKVAVVELGFRRRGKGKKVRISPAARGPSGLACEGFAAAGSGSGSRGRRTARPEEWKGRCGRTRGRGKKGVKQEEEAGRPHGPQRHDANLSLKPTSRSVRSFPPLPFRYDCSVKGHNWSDHTRIINALAEIEGKSTTSVACRLCCFSLVAEHENSGDGSGKCVHGPRRQSPGRLEPVAVRCKTWSRFKTQ
jgi:hypothetical protein